MLTENEFKTGVIVIFLIPDTMLIHVNPHNSVVGSCLIKFYSAIDGLNEPTVTVASYIKFNINVNKIPF